MKRIEEKLRATTRIQATENLDRRMESLFVAAADEKRTLHLLSLWPCAALCAVCLVAGFVARGVVSTPTTGAKLPPIHVYIIQPQQPAVPVFQRVKQDNSVLPPPEAIVSIKVLPLSGNDNNADRREGSA
ncbi:MAG: hypothetical protein HYZ00_11920 [Candidatus Hydrogenedentes bacterium]|nr:hypothetical protein [Candidatus Hydrogenedentota bacterium]